MGVVLSEVCNMGRWTVRLGSINKGEGGVEKEYCGGFDRMMLGEKEYFLKVGY